MLMVLPNEIIPLIYNNLAISDLCNLSRTSTHFYNKIKKDETSQELKRQRFILLFGAMASSETKISLDTLANRIHKSCQLSLSSEKQIVLKFDPQGIPYLEESKNNRDAEIFETVARHLDVIFNYNKMVFEELSEQSWEGIHPMQEYRNKIVRIKSMQREFAKLLQALEKTFPELKQIADTMQQKSAITKDRFQKLIEKLNKEIPYVDQKYDLLKRLKILQKRVSINKFLANNQFRAELGATDLEINGQKIPIKIVGEPFLDNSILIIDLYDENRDFLGEMKILRKWYKDLESLKRNETGDNILEDKNLQFSKSNFNVLALSIYHVKVHSLQDAQTGDRPLLRLLAQVAVEIFSREPARRLFIDSEGDHMDVYALMGFGSTSEDFTLCREDILAFRTLSGRLFPKGEEKGSYLVYMDKMEYSEKNQTKYFKKMDKKEAIEPAYIECDPHETITWEEQIRRKPLLNSFSGPLFWQKW